MDHNKIIAAAAKQSLSPLGLKRVGKSRTWYDDHGWWAIVVEFQPSGFSKGTYLNVGVSWFLYEKEHWTFDFGYREDDFSSARNEEQFSSVLERVSHLASTKVLHYRERVGSLKAARECIASTSMRSPWDHYHAGVLAALDSDDAAARQEFEQVLANPPEFQWQHGLQYRIHDLLRLLDDQKAFQETAKGIVLRCRAGMNLEDMSPSDIQFQ